MLIYAHRGSSHDYPELTESAYRAAVKDGADGFECDLRLSRDEVPVLWHNASMLERAGNPGLIAEMTFAQISQAYPSVLTLDSFLDIALESNKSVLLETKHPVITGNRIEEIIATTLADRKILKKIGVSVMSFSWGAIEKMHRLNPEIPTTFLMHQHTPFFQSKFSSAKTIGPGIDALKRRPDLVEKIKRINKSIAVWTVDLKEDVELCRDLGVDTLITNTPAQARSFL